jgi:hypothetical protein
MSVPKGRNGKLERRGGIKAIPKPSREKIKSCRYMPGIQHTWWQDVGPRSLG